jgi:hypothetical protein
LIETLGSAAGTKSYPRGYSHGIRPCPDHGCLTFPDRSARADVLQVSRYSCTLLRDVLGVFDYAESSGRSRIARFASVAFPLSEKGRHADCSFSQLNGPPASTSVYASTNRLIFVATFQSHLRRFLFSHLAYLHEQRKVGVATGATKRRLAQRGARCSNHAEK